MRPLTNYGVKAMSMGFFVKVGGGWLAVWVAGCVGASQRVSEQGGWAGEQRC